VFKQTGDLQMQGSTNVFSGFNASSALQTSRRIVVIGLGYVGLPLAVAFGRHQQVIGFDIDPLRIEELNRGYDRTGSVSHAELADVGLIFTCDPEAIRHGDFYTIVVPTPLTIDKHPDLTALTEASRTVGKYLKKGDIVVYESSVYPGATEDLCVPILEEVSNLVSGIDFSVGYSPERTNYGDKEHTLPRVVKVISVQDSETMAVIGRVYGSVIEAGLCEATSIRVAEAAKLVENIQRDVNIALMNEIAMIVNSMGLSTAEVLRVAGTKWNFVDFKPGLVGGHCVPIDPHYLIHSANKSGSSSELISLARLINDRMHEYIVNQTIKLMNERQLIDSEAQARTAVPPRVGLLGLTFKGDCPDIRESQPLEVFRRLKEAGFQPMVYDPLIDPEQVWSLHGVRILPIDQISDLSALIITVAHKQFSNLRPDCLAKLLRPGAPIVDVPGVLNVREFAAAGLHVWQL
jgi:UDP-N-acetyl-D-glucosamine/UDP-N-acetyl-D-galactosamine dehydrogenase